MSNELILTVSENSSVSSSDVRLRSKERRTGGVVSSVKLRTSSGKSAVMLKTGLPSISTIKSEVMIKNVLFSFVARPSILFRLSSSITKISITIRGPF